MSVSIDFYFDFSSAYTYIGLGRIERIAQAAGRRLNWLPIALGAIFRQREHSPPAPDCHKGRYIALDLKRCAAEQGLPFRWPKPFPYNSIPAARGFLWLETQNHDLAVEFGRRVFQGAFDEGRDMASLAELVELAARIGADKAAFGTGIQSPEIKASLIERTKTAEERGVFGAPTLYAGNEVFWGADRLYQLEHWLATGGDRTG